MLRKFSTFTRFRRVRAFVFHPFDKTGAREAGLQEIDRSDGHRGGGNVGYQLFSLSPSSRMGLPPTPISLLIDYPKTQR